MQKEQTLMKITKNKCCTYFRMVGNFDPEEITERLGLLPFKSWKTGDLRKNGTSYDYSCWEYGLCITYEVLIENQMRKTIFELLDKADELNKIRNDYDVSFYLEIVPEIHVDDIAPVLNPSMEVIDFCHATRTQIDFDYYLVNDQ